MNRLALLLTRLVVRKNNRARCMRLRIDPVSGEPLVTAPKRVSQKQISAFIEANQGWIADQQSRLEAPLPFIPGTVLPLLGQDVLLQHDPQHRGAGVLAHGVMRVGGQSAFFARRVRECIYSEALKCFQPQASSFMQALGVKDRAVKLRDTRSRWGSCSAVGEIHLSWRLAFAPPEVARYVIAHEVAHLQEHNHSPRFWTVVNQLVGECAAQRNWLKTKGPGLLRIGVTLARHEGGFPENLQDPTRTGL